MRVSELYPDNPCRGNEVFVIGLGPSMRYFPTAFLRGRCCVLLNDACRHFSDLGPIAFSNYLGFIEPTLNDNITHVVVKGYQKSIDKIGGRVAEVNIVPWDHPQYYVYSYRGYPKINTKLFEHPDFYWSPQGGTVAQFAVQFCLLAGAKVIYLVGIDCNCLDGESYAVDGMLDAKNAKLGRDYDAYAAGLVTLREVAMKRFKVPLLTLSPFMGLGREVEQYVALRDKA